MDTKKFVQWTLINGAVASALWFGLVHNVEGAKNVGIFALWAIAILSFTFWSKEVHKVMAKKSVPFSVPFWLDALYDIFIVCLLVWHTCFISGIMWVIQILNNAYLREEVTKLKENRE